MSARVIDAELAGFLTGSVSIIAGSRNADNRPALVRAHGCRVSRDGRRMGVLVLEEQAAEVLDDVRDNGRIAVVFTRPSTHRSVQVKGDDARVLRPRAGDRLRARAYRESMLGELAHVGVAAARVRALLAEVGSLAVIEFAVSGAFVQTPGPDAGRPLEGAA